MTAKRDLKRRVRERQARTGESYTAARAHVIREAEPTPVEKASAIQVDEMLELDADAARLGIKCPVMMSGSLARRVDPVRVLERVRDALLATLDDPAMEILRAVVLRGERPAAERVRDARWFDELRRFAARAHAGIGGITDRGHMLALHVDGVMVIGTVWSWRTNQVVTRLALSPVDAIELPYVLMPY